MTEQRQDRWYVYIIQSDKTGQLYVGSAKDPRARLKKHNAGKGAKFTRGRGPWRLLAFAYGGPDRSSALWREQRVKQLRRVARLQWVEQYKVDEKWT